MDASDRERHETHEEKTLFAGLFIYAPGKIRTCGLCLRRAALYPLSYGRAGA
jgi:hypothetical protein